MWTLFSWVPFIVSSCFIVKTFRLSQWPNCVLLFCFWMLLAKLFQFHSIDGRESLNERTDFPKGFIHLEPCHSYALIYIHGMNMSFGVWMFCLNILKLKMNWLIIFFLFSPLLMFTAYKTSPTISLWWYVPTTFRPCTRTRFLKTFNDTRIKFQ